MPVVREAVFDGYVAAFDVSGVTQAATERIREMGSVVSSNAGQEPDHRRRRLLRTRRHRPRRRAAEQRGEVAPFALVEMPMSHRLAGTREEDYTGARARSVGLASAHCACCWLWHVTATCASIGLGPKLKWTLAGH